MAYPKAYFAKSGLARAGYIGQPGRREIVQDNVTFYDVTFDYQRKLTVSVCLTRAPGVR